MLRIRCRQRQGRPDAQTQGWNSVPLNCLKFASLVYSWKASEFVTRSSMRFKNCLLTLAVRPDNASFLGCMRGLPVPPQTHVQSDHDRHYDKRTNTQDQKPPDHPHSRLG